MYRYLTVKENLFSPEIGAYVLFGVQVLEKTQHGWAQKCFVSDVSTDLEFVLHLTRLCNEEQLEPVHLNDVVLDFLNA